MKPWHLVLVLAGAITAIAAVSSAVSPPLSAQEAPAVEANVTATPPQEHENHENNGLVEVTITVEIEDNPDDVTWRDLHLKTARKFAALASNPNGSGKTADVQALDGAGNPTGDPQSWNAHGQTGSGSKKSGFEHISVYSDEEEHGFEGDAQITLFIHESDVPSNRKPVEWYLTSDGKKDPGALSAETNPNVIDEAGESELALNMPVAKIAVNDDDDILASIDATTAIPCSTEVAFQGRDYEIFTSMSLNEDYTDVEEIGINAVSDPVPGTWGLTFLSSTGTVDVDGEPSSTPSVVIPNDGSLVGQSFYVVFQVEGAPGGNQTAWASEPVEIVITN